MNDVVVIGGGAAGLAAAISATRQGARVTILEADDRVGRKILATGNGRCNLTNMHIAADAYNAPAFVAPVLKGYGPERIRSFFSQIGLMTYEEREGRVYPLSDSANSVLDVLRMTCDRMGVRIATSCPVEQVSRAFSRVEVQTVIGPLQADAVIVACGGGSDLLASCGHTIVPFSPVLCPLQTSTDALQGLSGVRVRARVSLCDSVPGSSLLAQEEGEVLFREYGLSGIVIFDLSRIALPGQRLCLDLLPDLGEDALRKELCSRLDRLRSDRKGRVLSNTELLTGIFHPRVIACVLHYARCGQSDEATREQVEAIARACKGICVKVKGPGNIKHAQVTRGGVLVDEVDSSTLESRRLPRLFVAGEALNVDGRCGGFNLHWAWSSGIVAGHNAARV